VRWVGGPPAALLTNVKLTAEATLRCFSDFFRMTVGGLGPGGRLSHVSAAAYRPAPHGERPQNDMMPATHVE
jgi:hypothetical protein